MLREPLAGRGAEWFDEVQVMMRRNGRTVPQIGRQQRQLSLNISAGSVPAHRRMQGAAAGLGRADNARSHPRVSAGLK